MTAPLATSTISPHAIAAQLPPRQRGALVELAAGRQPGIRAAGLEQRGLVEHDVAADVLSRRGALAERYRNERRAGNPPAIARIVTLAETGARPILHIDNRRGRRPWQHAKGTR